MTLPHARFTNNTRFEAPISKVVCVGRNYAEHAVELDNPVPTQPLLFIKPPTAVCDLEAAIAIPRGCGPVHYETEVALLIGQRISGGADEGTIMDSVAGIGLALDLTLRERQSQLKADGHPWEIAKAFDGACPLSAFVPRLDLPVTTRFQFTLAIDGTEKQHGDTADMLKPIPALLAYMAEHFTLMPGDVVLTGTPAGVGVLEPGQTLALSFEDRLSIQTSVA